MNELALEMEQSAAVHLVMTAITVVGPTLTVSWRPALVSQRYLASFRLKQMTNNE